MKYESNHFICLRHGYCHIHGSNRKVMEYCKEHGLNVNYSQTNVAFLPGNTDGVALVVSTTKVPYELDVRWLTACQLLLVLAKRKYWRKLFLS